MGPRVRLNRRSAPTEAGANRRFTHSIRMPTLIYFDSERITVLADSGGHRQAVHRPRIGWIPSVQIIADLSHRGQAALECTTFTERSTWPIQNQRDKLRALVIRTSTPDAVCRSPISHFGTRHALHVVVLCPGATQRCLKGRGPNFESFVDMIR
ncbi:hypothetical protein SCHPADRAFT_493330 [Schizopora paradoxa]|uniref:Uncharacterized protein n=1 Tax=Schizopora paradoxa TaxID=27342 RepID=A0A0H2RGJ1_9AGAM|nr:hypothetical protein SCHPADRAFT_493330 [Schizopora paradoxa]